MNSYSKLRLLRIPTSRISRLFGSKRDLQKKFISVEKEIQTSSIFLTYSEFKLVETCNTSPLNRTLQPGSEYVTLLRTDFSKILRVSNYYILITIKIQTCGTFKNLYRSTPTPNATAASAVVLHGASFAATTTRVRTYIKTKRNTHVNNYIYVYVYIMQGASFVAPTTCFFVRIQHKYKCVYSNIYVCTFTYIYMSCTVPHSLSATTTRLSVCV